jgi:hypothetical protein
VVEVDPNAFSDGISVSQTVPRVEDPDQGGQLVAYDGPSASRREPTGAEYSAKSHVLLLAVQWPEIKDRIMGEVATLDSQGCPFKLQRTVAAAKFLSFGEAKAGTADEGQILAGGAGLQNACG